MTLRLDALVTARRQAKAAWLATHALPVAHLPTRPGRLEFAVLTALAQVYGAALVQDSHFLPVLDAIASRGGVALVQRALWGEQSEDVRLAARFLLDARIAFEVLCGTWPAVFMAVTPMPRSQASGHGRRCRPSQACVESDRSLLSVMARFRAW